MLEIQGCSQDDTAQQSNDKGIGGSHISGEVHHTDCDHRIFLAIVRDSYVLHVEFNYLVRLSCPEIPLVRLLSKALTPLFDRLLNGLVSVRKKVVAFYDIRDRRAAGNLVLLVIPQEYGLDFLCRVCWVLLPDASLSLVRILRSET